MVKKSLVLFTLVLAFINITTVSQAALTEIGTANYNGSDYNLIWDDDNNGKSVIWFDFTNRGLNWADQNSWAAGVDSQLTYNINSDYSVIWTDNQWRLPSTNGTSIGYNETRSEIGHLYYTEFDLTSLTGGAKQGTATLNQQGFQHLRSGFYWYAEIVPDNQWVTNYASEFELATGYQGGFHQTSTTPSVMAIRTGQVSPSTVPIPSALLLLASGFFGLAAISRRKLKNKRG